MADLRRGFSFYEGKEEGLGSSFIEKIFSEIDALRHSAGIHPKHFGRFHRRLADTFPYAIYYQIEGEVVLIRSILDLRSNPVMIERRVKKTR